MTQRELKEEKLVKEKHTSIKRIFNKYYISVNNSILINLLE